MKDEKEWNLLKQWEFIEISIFGGHQNFIIIQRTFKKFRAISMDRFEIPYFFRKAGKATLTARQAGRQATGRQATGRQRRKVHVTMHNRQRVTYVCMYIVL
jgi:hypothetical protein